MTLETIAEIAPQLASGDCSPVELTTAILARIDNFNPRVNAYLHIAHEQAMAAAVVAEAEIAKGKYRGPLHGVPIAVKDLFACEGMPRTCASKVMNETSATDAAVIARLKAAGAVLLGKLNMTEFALSGYHPDVPIPVNPWAADRWAGVSSSGSGVATSLCMAFGTLGTDTGGSIRFPAAVNGVVGLKPTFGLVSKAGAFPLAQTLDTVGPITRCVTDAAIMLDAIAGFDPEDPWSLPGHYNSTRKSLEGSVAGRTLGVDESYVRLAHPQVADAVMAAIDVFRNLGAEIVEVELGDVLECTHYWGAVVASEAALAHSAWYPEFADSYGPVFRNALDAASSVRGVEYAAARNSAAKAASAFNRAFCKVDAILCPGAPLPAMPLADFPPAAILPEEVASQFVTFTAPMNFSGHPTLSQPCGFTDDGLPVGMQLVGPHLTEQRLLQFGKAYESDTQWHQRQPPTAH